MGMETYNPISIPSIDPALKIMKFFEYFLGCFISSFAFISSYDLVLDCSDNLATRYLINDACAVCGPKPLVSGSALRLEGQMTVYLANRLPSKEELASGNGLPKEARSPCFRCLYPVPPAANTVQGCSEAGVFGVGT